jgi:hypothetical protein
MGSSRGARLLEKNRFTRSVLFGLKRTILIGLSLRLRMIFIRNFFLAVLSLLPIAGFGEPIRLLNVSYDPACEFLPAI